MKDRLNAIGWSLLQEWYEGNERYVVERIAEHLPLEAAYLATYVGGYLAEDNDAALAFHDRLLERIEGVMTS